MIKIIDGEFTKFEEFKSFCKNDSFGTRIYSHFLCYGYEFDFVSFWVQINETGDISAAFCRIDGDFIVSLIEKADFDEISSFLSFQDKRSITFNLKYADIINLCYREKSTGDILFYQGNDKAVFAYDTFTPQLKDYHNLLLSCESDDFFVPEYLTFLSDVSRRQQRDLCDIVGIVSNNELVSCAMTVSYTDFSVILGAVATHPSHRKHGYAGCIVKNLAEKYKHLDSVYIYTTIERNTFFYESLGFVVSDKWIKYTYGG